MAKKKAAKSQKVCRDAITGKFITKDKACKNPKTTVTETVKKKAAKKKAAKKK